MNGRMDGWIDGWMDGKMSIDGMHNYKHGLVIDKIEIKISATLAAQKIDNGRQR